MARKIIYDRKISPDETTTETDETTTALTVSSETAPTEVSAANYVNFIYNIAAPGDTTTTTVGTCTDTQSATYTIIKEVKFAGFALDVWYRTATIPNVATTVTATHQPSKTRLISCDEWYNLASLEKMASSYSATATAQVDISEYTVGSKDWLTVAVLAIGGTAHDDSVSIPDDWNLLTDYGTDNDSAEDVRLVVCYQIANKNKKVDFRPVLSTARVWGVVMFSFKQKT